VIISAIVGTLIAFIAPYNDKIVVIQRALIFSNIFAFMLTILYTGVYFFNQWGHSHLEAEQLKRENLQSQFITLKNQVSPHFLFNSLSTLSSLISEDQSRATEFVQNLARVYRYVLQSIEKKVVDLETELKAAQAYVYLQKMRFGDRLKIDVQIPDVYKQLWIAPFTLQILLENAIKHNVISNDRPLMVQIYYEDNSLVIKNNLQRKSSVEPGTGVGLKNIVSRYYLLDKKAVEIYETNTQFIIKVPLFKESFE
jgi:LytS/YehU family sensor histidine kinase